MRDCDNLIVGVNGDVLKGTNQLIFKDYFLVDMYLDTFSIVWAFNCDFLVSPQQLFKFCRILFLMISGVHLYYHLNTHLPFPWRMCSHCLC